MKFSRDKIFADSEIQKISRDEIFAGDKKSFRGFTEKPRNLRKFIPVKIYAFKVETLIRESTSQFACCRSY